MSSQPPAAGAGVLIDGRNGTVYKFNGEVGVDEGGFSESPATINLDTIVEGDDEGRNAIAPDTPGIYGSISWGQQKA